jgi:hypothetical protein
MIKKKKKLLIIILNLEPSQKKYKAKSIKISTKKLDQQILLKVLVIIESPLKILLANTPKISILLGKWMFS